MNTKVETRCLKQRILDRYLENRSPDFGLHNELLALSCDAATLTSESEDPVTFGCEEVVFAVEKDWLITHLNRITNEYWTADKVKKWLKTEYTSEDSSAIFEAAILQKAVMLLEFN